MSDDSGSYRRWLKAASLSLLIAGLVASSACAREDTPLDATVPDGPAVESTSTTTAAATPTTSPAATTTTVVDLSIDDPATELLPDELDPEVAAVSEVERGVAPPGALYESSAEWLVGPFRDIWYGDPQAAPWLFPWGDGFLQIGFANTSEQIPSEMNLFARTSADGLNWGESFQLDLPREHFEALETVTDSDWTNLPWTNPWPIIESNGKSLVVLSQLPGRHFGARGARAARIKYAAPPNSHLEQRAFVSVTEDLDTWNHYEYPLLPPDDVNNPLLGNHVVAEDVIVSDEGWIIQISTLTYIDIGLLVPAEFRNAAERIWWSRYDDDVEYVGNEGLHIDAYTESTEFNNKLYSWEELGITRELVERYGVLSMKPYHFSDHFTGSLLVGKWGEGPVRVELPPVNGVCCEIVSTDAGYVGLSDAVEPGYPQGRFGWGALIFSSNGLTWQHIEPPGDERIRQPPATLGIWIPSVHVVEDRIVMHGKSWGISNGCDDRPLYEFFWVGDARGSNWESQNISDDPCVAKWYSVANSAGRGVLVYSDVSENLDTIGDRYHSTIVSIDGVNWFTFYEEHDPKRSSVAFNGNVAVRVDNAGNSYRYELP